MTSNRFLSRSKLPAVTVGLTLGAVLGVTGLLSTATAVHVSPPAPFELDGNALDSPSGGPEDWATVFNISTPFPGLPDADEDEGETFVKDISVTGTKETAFSGQSNKDIQLISQWLYQEDQDPTPIKDNITNAYAKAYSVNHDNNPATDEHLWIYFGADRAADNGTAALGFWFFQNEVGLNPLQGRTGTFSGVHAVGDILVQVDFVEASQQPDKIQIFEWVGSGGSHGSLHQLAFASQAGVTSICTPGDTACANVSTTATASPWAFAPKNDPANVFQPQHFFEGGIDITALVGDVCFSSFMAETRTSATETSELKDFALGDFDLCSIDVEKVCVNDTADPAPPNTSPVVDPFNETHPFQTLHTVTITNDGFGGTLQAIQVKDTTINATNKKCAIMAISGGTGNPSIPSTGIPMPLDNPATPAVDEGFVQVASSLSGSMAVALICNTIDNPFRNGVDVRSRASSTGPLDITDSDLESANEAQVCGITLDTGLVVKKWCQGNPGSSLIVPPGVNPYFQNGDLSVVLDPNNQFKPKVCVDIELSTTTSNQKMVINNLAGTPACDGTDTGDYFCDSDLGDLFNVTATQLTSGQILPQGGIVLNPAGSLTGTKVDLHACYSPTAPDNNQTNPGLVTYTDTVRASGHGNLDNVQATATPQSATCKLCPECPECD